MTGPPHDDAASPAGAPNGGPALGWWPIVLVATTLAVSLTAFAVVLQRSAPSRPSGLGHDLGDAVTVLPVPLEIPLFALTDHTGARFDESRLSDRWSFLFFGYTSCPDVCPITLGALRDMHGLLGESELSDVQVVFVSVDPERDSLDRLGRYVPHFDPAFLGATGEEEQIDRLAVAIGVYHARADEGSESGYLVDHTSAVFLVDPSSQLRAVFPAPHEPGAMTDAFRRIRAMPGP